MATSLSLSNRRKAHMLFAPFVALLMLCVFTLDRATAQFTGPSIVSIGSSRNPSQPSELVMFTATIATQYVSGTIVFYDGSATLGSVAVGQGGIATLSTSQLSPGAHSITAVYTQAGGGLTGTSSPLTQTVCSTLYDCNVTGSGYRGTANVTVYANKTSAAPGEIVGFSAYVTAANQLQGSVTFYDGNQILASKSVSQNGSASYSTSQLSPGYHSITARYSGDGLTAPASSAPVSVSIADNVPPPYVYNNQYYNTFQFPITTNQNPSFAGASVIFVASVGTQYAGATVTFFENGATLARVTIGRDGKARFSTSRLRVGNHAITATLSDSGASSFTLNQLVLRNTYSLPGNQETYYYSNPAPVVQLPATGVDNTFFAPPEDTTQLLRLIK